MTLLPSELAWKLGYDAVVADTVNHRLRGVTLSSGYVQTLAGNGVQRLLDAGPARVTDTGAGTWSEHHDGGPADFAADAIDVGGAGSGNRGFTVLPRGTWSGAKSCSGL